MKYVLIDDISRTRNIIDTEEFDSLDEAKKAADYTYRHLTEREVKERVGLYVLESADPDEDSERHLDGNEVYRLI